jgi:peptide/nickel transport system ATP-binding protein
MFPSACRAAALTIVGESGSGKSTAQVITGLLPPSEGQILFNN